MRVFVLLIKNVSRVFVELKTKEVSILFVSKYTVVSKLSIKSLFLDSRLLSLLVGEHAEKIRNININLYIFFVAFVALF